MSEDEYKLIQQQLMMMTEQLHVNARFIMRYNQQMQGIEDKQSELVKILCQMSIETQKHNASIQYAICCLSNLGKE